MLPVLWKTSWATKWPSKCLCLHCRRKCQRGTIIKSIFDYRFKSNKHTHTFLFVTEIVWVFIQTRRQDFAARAPKTTRGATFLNTILDVCSNRAIKHEMESTDFKLGVRAPLDLAGDGPVFIVQIRGYFGVQSGFIWNYWMGALHVTAEHKHLGR